MRAQPVQDYITAPYTHNFFAALKAVDVLVVIAIQVQLEMAYILRYSDIEMPNLPGKTSQIGEGFEDIELIGKNKWKDLPGDRVRRN